MTRNLKHFLHLLLERKSPPPIVVDIHKLEEKVGILPDEAKRDHRWWNSFLKKGWYARVNPYTGQALFRNKEIEILEGSEFAFDIITKFKQIPQSTDQSLNEIPVNLNYNTETEEIIKPNTCIKCGKGGPLETFVFVEHTFGRGGGVIQYYVTVPTCEECYWLFSNWVKIYGKSPYDQKCFFFSVVPLSFLILIFFAAIFIEDTIVFPMLIPIIFLSLSSIYFYKKTYTHKNKDNLDVLDPHDYIKIPLGGMERIKLISYEMVYGGILSFVRPDYASDWIFYKTATGITSLNKHTFYKEQYSE